MIGAATVLKRDLRVSGLQGHVEILVTASRCAARAAITRALESRSVKLPLSKLPLSTLRFNLSTRGLYRGSGSRRCRCFASTRRPCMRDSGTKKIARERATATPIAAALNAEGVAVTPHE